MFSKPNKASNQRAVTAAPVAGARVESPGEAPAQLRKPKVASLISSDITIEGGVSGDGELQIDGIVRGDVRVSRVSIGDTGHIEGSIFAEAAEIRGRVVGSVTAKQVRLYGTAYVDGDITHEQLAMETGAFFQGRSVKFQRPAALAAQTPSLQPVMDLPRTAEG